MIKARFQVRVPDGTWIAEISRSHPRTEFRLLTGIADDDGAVELGEVVGEDVDVVSDAIESHPAILEYEQLHGADGRALAQYRTTEGSLYAFLRDQSLPPEFPVVVTDGWLEFEVTATREQVRAMRSRLDAADWPHELLAIVGESDPDSLLTARQQELIDAALREGYYEVPRDCTLADLAAAVGVDKSTASGVLRRGEARILEWFMTGSGSDTLDPQR